MDKNTFGIDLKFYTVEKCSKHQHEEIELTYVLDGTLDIEIGDEVWHMQKDDILLVNSNVSHSWNNAKEALACVIKINYDLIQSETGKDYVNFGCNSVANKETDFSHIQNIMSQLITEYSIVPNTMNLKKKSLLYSLLDILLNHYVVEIRGKGDYDTRDPIIQDILKYIQKNYNQPISLSDMAERSYMANSTFSRYFKKHVGINFLEYLNNLRLNNSLEDLLYTQKALTDIALDNGFTNPSMFSKAFRSAFGMSPSDYKKKKKDIVTITEKQEDVFFEYKEGLEKYVQDKENISNEEIFRKNIQANVKEYIPYCKKWTQMVDAGSAEDLLSAKVQSHILSLKKHMNIKYVRLNNIFSWALHIRADLSSKYLNFESLDNILDFLITNDLHPMIEFGDKPKRILISSSNVLYEAEKRFLFSSEEDCAYIVSKFIDHVLARYGSEEIDQWYFDCWYDVRDDRNTDYDYLDIFDIISEIIKKRVPNAKVGGCGLELGNNFYPHIYEWKNRKHQPDFISVYAFPYKRMLPGYSLQPKGTIRTTDAHFFKNELLKLKMLLKEAKLEHIPIKIVEWNLSFSDRNYFNDSCEKAALMLMHMLEVHDEIDSACYFAASDSAMNFYDTNEMFFGGTGLLSKDGLPKPSAFALGFISKMGNYQVKAGDGYLITTNGKSSYYILLFNYKHLNYNFYAKEENQITMNDLKNLCNDKEPVEFELELEGVPDGDYIIKTSTMGANSGSPLNLWQKIDPTIDLDISDIKYLKRRSVPSMTISRQTTKKGNLHLVERLSACDMAYIHIYKQG